VGKTGIDMILATIVAASGCLLREVLKKAKTASVSQEEEVSLNRRFVDGQTIPTVHRCGTPLERTVTIHKSLPPASSSAQCDNPDISGSWGLLNSATFSRPLRNPQR
jgi:hypothetical protein